MRSNKQKTVPQKPDIKNKPFISMDPDEIKRLFLIVSLAIVFRLIYLAGLQDSVFFGNYDLDSKIIDLWANDIASGTANTNAFFRAPLYPYLIGLIYRIIGTVPIIVILAQQFIGIMTVLLTYFYGRYMFGKKVALLSGIIMAMWPTLIYFEGELLITSLAVFLSLSALISLHLAIDRQTPGMFFIGGIILGLAAIARPTILPIFLIVPIYAWLNRKNIDLKRVSKQLLICLAGVVIPILPITLRNMVVADDFVLISSQGGANFYIGNSKYADGRTVVMPMAQISGGIEGSDNIYTGSIDLAERRLGRELKDSEVSSYWFGEAFKEMLNDPGRAIWLNMTKFYYFWHGQEIFNNKSLYYTGDYSFLMKILIWKAIINFPSGLLFPLMIVGIFIAGQRKKIQWVPFLFLLIFSVTVAAFFVCARFRQPVIPVAVIFASYGIGAIAQAAKERSRNWKPWFVVIIAAFILLNLGGDIESDKNKSQYQNILGAAYLKEGKLDKAIPHLEAALRLGPGNQSASLSLAQAYISQNEFRKAEILLKEGVRLHPESMMFHYNLGILYYTYRKSKEGAKPHLWKAIELGWPQPDPYIALGSIYESEGKLDSARVVYEMILQKHPDHTPAREAIQKLAP